MAKNIKINMEYKKEDYNLIIQINKGGGIPNGDVKKIYDLYKTYIQPDIDNWADKCYSCGNILPLFYKVRDFMNENKDKFI